MKNEEEKTRIKKSLKWLTLAVLFLAVILILSNFNGFMEPVKTFNKIVAPIVGGFVIAYLINYIYNFFTKKVFKKCKNRKFINVISIIISYIIFIALIIGFFSLIIPELIKSVQGILPFFKTENLEKIFDQINGFLKKIPFITVEDDFVNLERIITKLGELINKYTAVITEGLTLFISGTIMTIINILVAFMISIYVICSKERIKLYTNRISIALFQEKTYNNINNYTKLADQKFGGFIIGKIIDSIIIGIITYIILLIFKIPSAILVSTIVMITNVVPVYGPFIGAIPSAIIILIQSPIKAVIFTIAIIAIQQFDGNLLGPLCLGNSTGISPLAIIVSITFFGGLFGFIGMVIAVPLTSLIIAIVEDSVNAKLEKKSLHEKKLINNNPKGFNLESILKIFKKKEKRNNE